MIHFRADEAPLHVRVDLPGSLRRLHTFGNRPGTRFRLPGGEECQNPQQRVGLPREAHESRLAQPHASQKIGPLFLGQGGQLRFQLPADRHHARAALGGKFAYRLHHRFIRRRILRDIRHEQHRLGREQLALGEDLPLLRSIGQIAQPFAFVQQPDQLLEKGHFKDGFLVAGPDFLFGLLFAPVERLQIGQHQLCFNHPDVPQGIDASVDVHNIRAVEAADHMEQRVDLADMPQKLIAEPLPFAGPFHQARDVAHFKGAVRRLF